MTRYKITVKRNNGEIWKNYTIQGWDSDAVLADVDIDVEFYMSLGLDVTVAAF